MSEIVERPASSSSAQNGMGVAALVLGILGLVFCLGYTLILPILAVIFGALGRKKADDGLATNKGMATAGLAMGIVGVSIGAIIWFMGLLGSLATPFMSNY